MYTLRGLSKFWRMDVVEVPALQAVDVAFAPGQATAIVGPSGSGKSTLLHVAALLDSPSAGEVWFEGRCLSALSDDARSGFRLRRLGFVHQTYPMVVALTPLENVSLPAEYAGVPRAEARARGQALLDRVGLGGHAHRDVRTLSGGERQRVAIARALVNAPAVVFADEPTAALDTASGAQVLDVLFEAAQAEGVALVLATHDPGVAGRAHRVLRMDGGRVVSDTAGAE
jgi:ABC-type lipoprotein export system ATPase subunit